MSEWIVEMRMAQTWPQTLRVALPPVMLPTGALATECRIFAAGEWLCIMRDDGGAFTKEEVRALQGLPRVPAPWVDGPPPEAGYRERDAHSKNGLQAQLPTTPPAVSREPDLDPYPGG